MNRDRPSSLRKRFAEVWKSQGSEQDFSVALRAKSLLGAGIIRKLRKLGIRLKQPA